MYTELACVYTFREYIYGTVSTCITCTCMYMCRSCTSFSKLAFVNSSELSRAFVAASRTRWLWQQTYITSYHRNQQTNTGVCTSLPSQPPISCTGNIHVYDSFDESINCHGNRSYTVTIHVHVGVLCCFALLFACFFRPSSALITMYMYTQ